jgi:hypothetical protein
MEPLSLSSCLSSKSLLVGDCTEKGVGDKNQARVECNSYKESTTSNLKNILQVHLFDRIWKSGNKATKIGTALIRAN